MWIIICENSKKQSKLTLWRILYWCTLIYLKTKNIDRTLKIRSRIGFTENQRFYQYFFAFKVYQRVEKCFLYWSDADEIQWNLTGTPSESDKLTSGSDRNYSDPTGSDPPCIFWVRVSKSFYNTDWIGQIWKIIFSSILFIVCLFYKDKCSCIIFFYCTVFNCMVVCPFYVCIHTQTILYYSIFKIINHWWVNIS